MSKIRLIKERIHDVDCYNDLRGLGNTTLLSNTGVEPRLIFKGNSSRITQELGILAGKLNNEIEIKSLGEVFSVTTKRKHPNHKVDFVNLFNIIIYLFDKKVTNSAILEETNWLHDEISRSVSGPTINVHEFHKNISADLTGISISPLFTHILSQAGYAIPANSNPIVLTEESISKLIIDFKSSRMQQNKILRAA